MNKLTAVCIMVVIIGLSFLSLFIGIGEDDYCKKDGNIIYNGTCFESVREARKSIENRGW